MYVFSSLDDLSRYTLVIIKIGKIQYLAFLIRVLSPWDFCIVSCVMNNRQRMAMSPHLCENSYLETWLLMFFRMDFFICEFQRIYLLTKLGRFYFLNIPYSGCWLFICSFNLYQSWWSNWHMNISVKNMFLGRTRFEFACYDYAVIAIFPLLLCFFSLFVSCIFIFWLRNNKILKKIIFSSKKPKGCCFGNSSCTVGSIFCRSENMIILLDISKTSQIFVLLASF